MRIAYIILAHKLPEQLVRLVRKLNTNDTFFFIHVDKKTGDETYRSMIEPLSEHENVYFLERRVCNWGDFGHVEATLDGIHTILDMGLECDYILLLTVQDYPIKSNSHIQKVLSESEGNSFIENFSLPSERWKNENGGMDRLNYWHFNWRGQRFGLLKKNQIIFRFFNRLWLRAAEILQIRPKLPEKYRIFGGSSYWCLTRESAAYIDEFVKQNIAFVKFFKHALIPDEIFFHTILLNSPFKDRIINNDLRYIAWSDSPNPEILNKRHLEEFINSDDLFARKFDITVDVNVLDMIDQATT